MVFLSNKLTINNAQKVSRMRPDRSLISGWAKYRAPTFVQHLSQSGCLYQRKDREVHLFLGRSLRSKCWTVVLAAVRAARSSEMRHLCLIDLLPLALLIDQDSGQIVAVRYYADQINFGYYEKPSRVTSIQLGQAVRRLRLEIRKTAISLADGPRRFHQSCA